MSRRVLFIDDDVEVLENLRRGLCSRQEDWQMCFATSIDEAIELAKHVSLDLIVSKLVRPGRDGFDLLASLRNDPETYAIPLIAVVDREDRELRERALRRGAIDLLSMPLDETELVARVTSALRLSEYEEQLSTATRQMERQVEQRTAGLEASRLDLIWRLARAGEFRDESTGHHVMRVGFHAKILAEEMGLDREFQRQILCTAPLHDIGKIGIPDSILLKPGPLNHEEWLVMRKHTILGAAILGSGSTLWEMFRAAGIEALDGEMRVLENPLLEMAARIALNHHERWDGNGYPHGLAKEEIPIEARITAIADVFDALRTARPYKPAMHEEETLQFIRRATGRHFDRAVYDAFDRSLPRTREFLEDYQDRIDETHAAPVSSA